LEKLMYSPVAAPDLSPALADRSSGILALREKGLDAGEISKILAVPAGEVELILNLNKKNRP
jgi:transcriptional regulator